MQPIDSYREKGFFGCRRFELFDDRVVVSGYRAFTNDSLTMMYEGIRGALASDDAQEAEGDQPRFGIRETPDWRVHAANLESEMLRRGMFFQIIDWSEDQAQLPF